MDVAEALLRILLETTIQKPADRLGRPAREQSPVRVPLENRCQRFDGAVPSKRPLAGEHFVQHTTERPVVSPLVHRLAARLFRRHVSSGAKDRSRRRQGRHRDRRRLAFAGARPVARLERLGEPEVQYLDGTIGTEPDVCRFQVAMDDICCMGRVECLGDLPRDRERLANWQGLSRDPLREILAVHEFHDERRRPAAVLDSV